MTDDFRDDRSDSRPDPEQGARGDARDQPEPPQASDPAGDDARSQRRAERRRRVRERTFDTSIASPCIAVCQLDTHDVCIGCQRTMDEIRDWPILTADEKRDVLARVEARKQAT